MCIDTWTWRTTVKVRGVLNDNWTTERVALISIIITLSNRRRDQRRFDHIRTGRCLVFKDGGIVLMIFLGQSWRHYNCSQTPATPLGYQKNGGAASTKRMLTFTYLVHQPGNIGKGIYLLPIFRSFSYMCLNINDLFLFIGVCFIIRIFINNIDQKYQELDNN